MRQRRDPTSCLSVPPAQLSCPMQLPDTCFRYGVAKKGRFFSILPVFANRGRMTIHRIVPQDLVKQDFAPIAADRAASGYPRADSGQNAAARRLSPPKSKVAHRVSADRVVPEATHASLPVLTAPAVKIP